MVGIFSKQKVVNKVLLLPVEEISASPYQPRRQFEPKALQELAVSIRENGLLQPVTVRETEKGYELVSGERRLIACKMNGMERIPAIVEQYDDSLSATFALVENLQRKDLNYFEEAAGIQQLMQQGGLTQQQVAEKLGKAQSTVANKLRLLQFSAPLQRQMIDSGLTERHARALLRLTDEQQVREVLAQIVQSRLNVGETERLIDLVLAQKQKRPKKATRLFIVKDMRIFMNTISKAVSTMKLAGIEIDTMQVEDEEYINYTMKIPKKSAYHSEHA